MACDPAVAILLANEVVCTGLMHAGDVGRLLLGELDV
jgi:hypothetical protein